jgi:CRISPR-associated protein Cas1
MNRLLVKVNRDALPQIKDKYPFLYLERGCLEVDDSNAKWNDCEKNVVHLPIATIGTLFWGSGMTLTHESVKVLAFANCGVYWVGRTDSFFILSVILRLLIPAISGFRWN